MSGPLPTVSSFTQPVSLAAVTPQQQPVASTSSTQIKPPLQKASQRKRLTKDGVKIFNDYFWGVNQRPDAAERRRLCEIVNQLVDCEWYTPANVEMFFANRRSSLSKKTKTEGQDTPGRRKGRPSKSTTDAILWPALSPDTQTKLAVLLKETPHPPKKIVNVWAEALHTHLEQVQRWVECHEVNNGAPQERIPRDLLDSEDDVDIQLLPTPEATASPEPSRQALPPPIDSAPYSPLSPISPIAPFNARRQLNELPTSSGEVTQLPWWSTHVPDPVGTTTPLHYTPHAPLPPKQTPPPLQIPTMVEPMQVPATLILQSMARACQGILSEGDHDPAPTTFAEFAQRFAPYEQQMQEFLHNVTSGVYANIGLTAAMIPEGPLFKVEPNDPE